MCLGIPGLVIERHDPDDELPWALVEFSGLKRKVCTACVPESQPGDYVIVHAGIAISRIDADEAARIKESIALLEVEDEWDDPSPHLSGGNA